MAQILVREVDEETKRRLKARAKSHGRSMEAEIRDILRDAVKPLNMTSKGLGSEISKLFEICGLVAPESIVELKGSIVKSPFDQ